MKEVHYNTLKGKKLKGLFLIYFFLVTESPLIEKYKTYKKIISRRIEVVLKITNTKYVKLLCQTAVGKQFNTGIY